MSGQKSQIDRYYIEMEGDICGPVLMERVDANGEWVRYEDHKAEIETLSSKINECGLECSEGLNRLAAENEHYKRRVEELSIHAEKWVKRALTPAHEREAPHCSTCGCGMTNPFDKARAVFAGKRRDAYMLKLWFDTQEDLDAAFDAVEGTSQPPGDGQ